MAQSANPRTLVIAAPEIGADVEIMPPDNPSFDANVRHLFPLSADSALAFKPYEILFINHSKLEIAAYAIKWRILDEDDHGGKYFLQVKYPDAIAGQHQDVSFPLESGVKSGQMRLVGVEFDIGSVANNPNSADHLREGADAEKARFASAKSISVSVDEVIFSDGSCLGSDEAKLVEHFTIFVRAKQALYREIVAKVNGGSSIEDVVQEYKEQLQNQLSQDIRRTASGETDLNALYSSIAIQEVVRLYSLRQKDFYSTIRASIRPEDFTVIKRAP